MALRLALGLTCGYNAPMSALNRSNVEEIKAKLPIEEVIGGYIKLERSGKAFKARCPFHNEKTPSFFVSPDRGGYYCFGCNAKGDIFTFVEQFEGLDFKGALKVLADRAGVKLTFDQKADTERDRLFQIMEDAARYFEGELKKSPEAMEYLKKRGLADGTIAEFRIGFAPEGWRNLFQHLQSKKWPNDFIEKAGLAKRAEDNTGNYYDRFRGRIMFPISDSSGRIIAFTGRILPRLDDDKAAKYLNSPDMPLYDKSSVLFGLDKAKSYIRRLDYSILVEGQMDLIMSHQAGVKNAVAASGTALTDAETNRSGAVNNLGLLRRLSGNVIIAFDSDTAGRKAAMRAAGIGLSLGMDVKIADITGGKDPADLILADPEDWKNVLRRTKPVVEFELGNVMKEVTEPRKTPKALRDRVFPFVVAVESETDKAFFVKMIADRAGIAEQAIWDDLKKMKAAEASPKPADIAVRAEPSRRIDLVERRMFGLLALLKRENDPKASEYEEMIKKISGDSFAARRERARQMESDLLFEAESFFGADMKRSDAHMRDLLANFEEDLVGEELVSAMGLLRAKEKAGDQAAVAELAKKCQALSVRKAQLHQRA